MVKTIRIKKAEPWSVEVAKTLSKWRKHNKNLRLAPKQPQNNSTRGKRKYIGIRKRNAKWAAHIQEPRDETYFALGRPPRLLWLGTFPSRMDAARAYDIAARAIYGPHAHSNFPTSTQEPMDVSMEPSSSGSKQFVEEVSHSYLMKSSMGETGPTCFVKKQIHVKLEADTSVAPAVSSAYEAEPDVSSADEAEPAVSSADEAESTEASFFSASGELHTWLATAMNPSDQGIEEALKQSSVEHKPSIRINSLDGGIEAPIMLTAKNSNQGIEDQFYVDLMRSIGIKPVIEAPTMPTVKIEPVDIDEVAPLMDKKTDGRNWQDLIQEPTFHLGDPLIDFYAFPGLQAWVNETEQFLSFRRASASDCVG